MLALAVETTGSPDLIAVSSSRRRQPLLFATASPLVARFGADFFGSLPTDPGVYFFYDEGGKLLYIGQSGCLKHRLGSYRHVDPDRHPHGPSA